VERPETLDVIDILFAQQKISSSTVDTLKQFVSVWGCTSYEAILETNICLESDLADFLAEWMKVDRVFHLATSGVSSGVLDLLPFSIARQCMSLPLRFLDNEQKSLEVVMANPLCQESWKLLKKHLDYDLVVAIGEQTDILNAIDEFYPLKSQIPAMLADDDENR
jgi:hypothetical protein